MKSLTAVDLFSGCGGLSLGMREAGFQVVGAVEVDATAAETYRTNHPNTTLVEKDICSVTGTELLREIGAEAVSLVMGCAPCQGFCSLTRKAKKPDPRNRLVLEMSRVIDEVRPSAVMMENVPGLLTSGKDIFRRFVDDLEGRGYVCEYDVLQMADYGVPQNRRRLVLLAGKGFRIPLPEPTHARDPQPGSGLVPWVTLLGATGRRPAPVTLSAAKRDGGPQRHNWHVVRDLQPQTKRRLRAAMPGKTWRCVDESLRPECHRNGYVGFTNTYGRMTWDEISVTITAGCTTPCKGRFGHPDRRRFTISVREAALVQTFPEDYAFVTDYIDAVCDLIGNAVPPRFAETLGRTIRRALESRHDVD
jgi:DNA (cytosine-5)-methyltransferase 1